MGLFVTRAHYTIVNETFGCVVPLREHLYTTITTLTQHPRPPFSCIVQQAWSAFVVLCSRPGVPFWFVQQAWSAFDICAAGLESLSQFVQQAWSAFDVCAAGLERLSGLCSGLGMP
jgi:hypothetical protein